MATALLKPGRKRGVNPARLNSAQRAFAEEYLSNGMVGPAAYLKAYPNCKSRKAARSKAYQLLRNPKVRGYIEKKLADAEDYELRQAELKGKMNRIDRFNLMHEAARVENGFLEVSPESYERIADEIGDCVTEVEFVQTEATDSEPGSVRVRVKLMDKDKNFDRLLRYYQLLNPVDGSVNVNLNGFAQLLEEVESERKVIDAEYIERAVEEKRVADYCHPS